MVRLFAMVIFVGILLFGYSDCSCSDEIVTVQGYMKIADRVSWLDFELSMNKLFYIPDVRVVAKSRQTGIEYETFSDSTGFYSLELPVESVGVHATEPMTFALHQNYPNPFNPSTTISYDLSADSDISLRIYNISGQLVTSLLDCRMPAGRHSVQWHGCDSHGSGVSAGVYFYRLYADNQSEARKMLLLDGNVQTDFQGQSASAFFARKASETVVTYDLTMEKVGYNTRHIPMSLTANQPIVESHYFFVPVDYFPLEVGNSWTFQVDKEHYEQQLYTYTITGTKEMNGYTYYIFDSFPIFFHYRRPPHVFPDEVLVRRDASGSLRLWEGTTDVVLYLFALPRPSSPLTMHEFLDKGTQSNFFYHAIEIGTVLESVNETLDDFFPCYYFRAFVYGAVESGGRYWFAPGVGPVKVEKLGFSHDTYTLISATIGGVESQYGKE